MELESDKALREESLADDLPERMDIERHSGNESVMFFFLGISSTFTVGALFSAIDVFQSRCGILSIGVDLSRSFYVPFCILILITASFPVPTLYPTLIATLVILILAMIATGSLIIANVNSNAMYWCVVSIAATCGVASALLVSSVRGLTARFGGTSAALVLRGSSCCGVISSALRVITKASLCEPAERLASASSHFFLCALPMIIALIIFQVKMCNRDIADNVRSGKLQRSLCLFSSEMKDAMSVYWPGFCAMFLNSMITWSLFPGYLTRVTQDPSIMDWTPVVVTTLFFVFAWLGRAWSPKVDENALCVRVVVVMRLCFYPIFMVSIGGLIDLGEPIWTFCWVVLFALSDGYGASEASGGLDDDSSPELKKRVHQLRGIAMLLGMLAGLCLTFFVK